MNPALRDELIRMQRDDLALRERLVDEGTLFDGYAPRMAALHRVHATRLRAILSEHGWPGFALVGADGAEAAWLVLQHAMIDPVLVRAAVPLLERAVDAGDARPAHLAYLVDRIRTVEGRAQVYGTQHDWDEHGALSPSPIEDESRVDERRAAVGLEPLADHTRRLRDRAIAENERPPRDVAARARDQEAWARATGWRAGD